MSIELQYLILAAVLVLIQMIFQVVAGVLENGLSGAVGSQDDRVLATGIGGRFERAYYNMLETFPVFAALVLTVQVSESWTAITALGAQLYFWGRVLYLPAYIIAIPLVRTLVWIVSMAGIIMIGWELFGLIV